MINLLAEVGAGAIGLAIGRRFPRRRPALVKPIKSICGCGHAVGFHTEGTGNCAWHHEIYRHQDCGCQQYDGPVPLPTYYARDVLP